MSRPPQVWRLVVTDRSGDQVVLVFDDWTDASFTAMVQRRLQKSVDMTVSEVIWRVVQ